MIGRGIEKSNQPKRMITDIALMMFILSSEKFLRVNHIFNPIDEIQDQFIIVFNLPYIISK